MTLSIMLTIMVIGYKDHSIAIELSRLEGWELIDKGIKDGGIAEFYLKGRDKSIVFPVHIAKDWKDLREFMNRQVLNISEYTRDNNTTIIQQKEPF